MTTIQHPYVAAIGALIIALCVTLAGAQAVPTIQLLQPNGGEFWQAGTVQQITWTSANLDPGGQLALFYKVNNGDWQGLGGTTPDQTSYSWTVPNTPGAITVLVGNWITGRDWPWEVYDESDTPLTILPIGPQTMWTVESTDTGAVWTEESTGAVWTEEPTDTGAVWTEESTGAVWTEESTDTGVAWTEEYTDLEAAAASYANSCVLSPSRQTGGLPPALSPDSALCGQTGTPIPEPTIDQDCYTIVRPPCSYCVVCLKKIQCYAKIPCN